MALRRALGTMAAIRVHRPNVLQHELDAPRPAAPAAGENLVRVHYAGVNFIDTYHAEDREFYHVPRPFVPGVEGAGIVAATGQRVAFVNPRRLGAYAEYAVVPAATCVPVPDALPLDVAAGALLQGMTVHMLVHSVAKLPRGSAALVHAAAGGCGKLLTRWLAEQGVRVIATCSTPDKAAVARAAGAADVVAYDDFAVRAKALTGGRGVDAVCRRAWAHACGPR